MQANAAQDKAPNPARKIKPSIKSVSAAAVVVAIIIISAAYLAQGSAAPPIVAIGDNVSVFYTGSFTNGTVFGSNFNSQPFSFIAGSNQVIPGFSAAVIGMKLNQTKNVTIPVNQAYGPVNPSLVILVPRSAFGNQSISIGEYVALSSNYGSVRAGTEGRIEVITPSNVTVNFNNPLAGKTLVFEIKVAAIRKGCSIAQQGIICSQKT